MKAYLTRAADGIEALTLTELPSPGKPGPGQVRIKVRAASLNYRDLLVVSGGLGPIAPEGLIPCSDGAGEVLAVGPDVHRVAVGDRVAMTFIPDWVAGPWRTSIAPLSRGYPLPGVMCEEMLVHQNELVVLPDHLSFEEGAALPCAGVTAWHSLCGAVPLLPGRSVLLQGAGGVSVFALQFAKLFGARVIVTSSSDKRCQRLEALGADETINYNKVDDWDRAVRELTGGEGADLTVEVGGAATIDRALAATRKGGRLALVGLLTGWPNQTSALFAAGVDITPVRVGSRNDFEDMNRAMDYHRLHPVIDRQFAFDELPDALRYLETGRQFGKIAISF